MVNSCNANVSNLAQYDSLSTDELRELLRLDFDAPVKENLDTDTILYIAGLIADREKNNPRCKIRSTEEAYAIFQKYYMPKE